MATLLTKSTNKQANKRDNSYVHYLSVGNLYEIDFYFIEFEHAFLKSVSKRIDK